MVNNISYEEIKNFLLETNFQCNVSIESYIKKILNNADFIIYRDTNIYGLCIIYANNIELGFAYITYIAITKKKRGKGIGQKLLSEACCYAKKKGFNKIRLEVKKNNTIALRLYTQNGFHVFDECEASLFMQKKL